MAEAGPGLLTETSQEGRPGLSTVVLEALRSLAPAVRTLRCLSDTGRSDPLDPTWLTHVAGVAESDAVLARSLANRTVAQSAGRTPQGTDLTIAVPAPQSCPPTTGPSDARSWVGNWAAVRPPGEQGVVALLPGSRSQGSGPVHVPRDAVRLRGDWSGAEQGDLWLLDLDSDLVGTAPPAGEARAVRVALRAADDAVAVGLMRAACRADVEATRAQRLPGWSGELRMTVTADLCLEYEAAVAMSIGATHVGRSLAPPEQDLLSGLCRYWTGRAARRIAARRATATGPWWPDLDPAALGLLRHAAVCAASGGTPEQVLSDVDSTLTMHPWVLDSLFDLVREARGRDRLLDEHIRRLRQHLLRTDGQIKGSPHVVREIALLLQAAFVAKTCPGPVQEAFLRTRLGPEPLPHLAQGLSVPLQSMLLDRM